LKYTHELPTNKGRALVPVNICRWRGGKGRGDKPSKRAYNSYCVHTTNKLVCRTLTAMLILFAEDHRYKNTRENMSDGLYVCACDRKVTSYVTSNGTFKIKFRQQHSTD
jgi:hypothetical protein